MPHTYEYSGWEYAPLRLAVWILAAVYLGRVHYNNTLWDLRQRSAFEYAVKSLAIAVVLAFAYWNVALADPDMIAMIWGVALFFAAKVLLVAGVIRLGGALADYEERTEQRRFEAATASDGDDD
jgi:hypothetical protein